MTWRLSQEPHRCTQTTGLPTSSLRFQGQMAVDTKSDFQALRKALVDFHGITPNHYRVKWRDLVPGTNKPYQQFFQRVKSTGELWTKAAVTREELLDLILKEKLVSSLPPTIQSWVRTQDPSSGKEAARLADDYVHSQPKLEELKRWSRPDATRTFGPTERSRPYQRPVGSKPEPSRPDTTPVDPRGLRLPSFDPVKGPRCYHCQEYRHIAAKCPTKTCLVSITNTAPPFLTYPGTVNGEKVDRLLVDTACNISQIHPKWLSKDSHDD